MHISSTRFALATLLAIVPACAPVPTGGSDAGPSHCVELDTSVSGLYTLYLDADLTKPWIAYCDFASDMPAEYLPLVPVAGRNFSQISDGASVVTTTYAMVRIDPGSLAIDVGDRRYATSEGSALIDGVKLTAAPFGVAFTPEVFDAPPTDPHGPIDAHSNIDLRGTAFVVDVRFEADGGDVVVSPDGRVVDLYSYRGAVAAIDTPRPWEASGFILDLHYFPCAEGVCPDAGVTVEELELPVE
jgi:hypothetical protein